MADTPTWQEANTAFERVIVDYLVVGTARVSWTMNRHFIDRRPHVMQLQGSNSQGALTADDWVDIGPAQENAGYLTDTGRRVYGKTATMSYRVKMTTSMGTYYSDVAGTLGKFTRRDWLLASEIMRKELLRHQVFGSVPGWLLKAKRYGEECTCLDPFTKEVTDSTHAPCHGTGFLTGYYAPMAFSYCELRPISAREHRDMSGPGTAKGVVTSGRFIGVPDLIQGDAFICDGSDERYYIHTVTETAAWKGVPLVLDVEMRLAPFTDAIYEIDPGADYQE